jgi:hypothetical protein
MKHDVDLTHVTGGDVHWRRVCRQCGNEIVCLAKELNFLGVMDFDLSINNKNRKKSLYFLIKCYAIKAYGGVEVSFTARHIYPRGNRPSVPFGLEAG